jgi:hypothetical protein
MECVQRGRVYDDPAIELQLPESHLVFRLPQGFNGRLAVDGAFKIFSADRQVSCFVFVHGPGTPLPANWMTAELTIEDEKLVAIGAVEHAQSDLVYRSFEGDKVLCYKFEKTNRRGAGLHGSVAGFKTEADRITKFLKSFLSSFHRYHAALAVPVAPVTSLPPPTPPPAPTTAPPPAAPIVTRDQRLYGVWYYSPPSLGSGYSSMVTFRFRYFAPDGRFSQGVESYATFVKLGGGGWGGMDTLYSKSPPSQRGTWESGHGVLTLHYDDETVSDFSYYVEGNSMLLSQPSRERQLWTRG